MVELKKKLIVKKEQEQKKRENNITILSRTVKNNKTYADAVTIRTEENLTSQKTQKHVTPNYKRKQYSRVSKTNNDYNRNATKTTRQICRNNKKYRNKNELYAKYY
ncbi:hypothetical protein PUN28_019165 [Cardiocondyla obscurior]|uniref:Uncharacterized protein n=1 Tax=Cardiocondyla obscurior TaxID=286306 RepID=A0AAW2EHI7_9HYME